MTADRATDIDDGYSAILSTIEAELSRRASMRWDSSSFGEALNLHDEGLGLDSVGVIDFLLHCEQRFDIVLPEEFLDSYDKTVGDLARAIADDR